MQIQYTEMNSKVGNFARRRPEFELGLPMPKQLNLNKWDDTGKLKFSGCRRRQKPTFESISVYRIKKLTILSLFLLCCRANAAPEHCHESFGIVGGGPGAIPPAYFVLSNGAYSDQLLPSSLGPGTVYSVSINGEGTALVGGMASGAGFAYYIYPDGTVSPRLISEAASAIYSVSINNQGLGLAGGIDATNNAIAYLINPSNNSASPLFSESGGEIESVAINNTGQGIAGGYNALDGLIYYVYPDQTATQLIIPNTGTSGDVSSVAINASGIGLIGGADTNSQAFVYYVSPTPSLSPTYPTALLPTIDGYVSSVAINSSGVGLVGVNNNLGPPQAYFVYPNLTTSSQLLSTFTAGSVQSVALNDSQLGLIGGFNVANPFLYYVYPDGTLSQQLLPMQMGGTVNSVVINQFGTGFAISDDGSNSIGYLVSPSGVIARIYPTLGGTFDTAAMIQSLSQIITVCLGGNDLILAKYLNKYAPEKAFYFLPSLVNGTLGQALASVAPTRNAASIFAMDNNIFLLNESLSRHLRDQRHVRRYHWGKEGNDNTTALDWESEDGLLASADWPSGYSTTTQSSSINARPFSLWSDVITAFSYQKGEHQTPGFDPWTAGLILGFETELGYNSQIGGGTAYTFTYIWQHASQGHSNINQEYLFAYGLFSSKYMYIDAALWGGLFQAEQVRNIHLEGFHFKSRSYPTGVQASPHFELGGDIYLFNWLTLEPFIMSDWANTWQDDFKEKGSGPFNMGQKRHYSSLLRNEGGIRFYEAIPGKSARITFMQKASYVNKKPFGIGTVNAFLVGSPGSFTVETLSTPQNLGVGELAIIFEPLDLKFPYGAITYQGEFGSAYQSHQILLETCWSF